MINEIIKPTDDRVKNISLNGAAFLFHFSMLALTCFAGSKLKAEAKATASITSQIMNQTEWNETQKLDFMFLMTQINSRNHSVQNKLFNFDMKTFLTVSS